MLGPDTGMSPSAARTLTRSESSWHATRGFESATQLLGEERMVSQREGPEWTYCTAVQRQEQRSGV